MTTAAKTTLGGSYVHQGQALPVRATDGGDVAYYLAAGGSTGVLVFQQGQWAGHASGNGDAFDLQSRNAALMSAGEWPANLDLAVQVGGILDDASANNPTLHSAAHGFVPYLTSDCWLGNRTAAYLANGITTAAEFRGFAAFRAIVSAVVGAWAAKSAIAFVGQDASGWGLLHHWPWVYDTCQAAGIEPYGIVDGWLPHAVTPYTGVGNQLASDSHAVREWWGVAPHFPLPWDAATLCGRMTEAQRSRLLIMAFQTATNWAAYHGMDVGSIDSSRASWLDNAATAARAHAATIGDDVRLWLPWHAEGTSYSGAAAMARLCTGTRFTATDLVASGDRPADVVDTFMAGGAVEVIEEPPPGGHPSIGGMVGP